MSNLTMARVSGDAGYVTNYYRYFGTSEAPFDWYQSAFSHFAALSTAGVWMCECPAPGRHRDVDPAVALAHSPAGPPAGHQSHCSLKNKVITE